MCVLCLFAVHVCVGYEVCGFCVWCVWLCVLDRYVVCGVFLVLCCLHVGVLEFVVCLYDFCVFLLVACLLMCGVYVVFCVVCDFCVCLCIRECGFNVFFVCGTCVCVCYV